MAGAAAFCNWLSHREGIGREQWCYNPEQPIGDGMVLYGDYLQRSGYRLPSEAEWEYACRAAATTARYFGETEVRPEVSGGVLEWRVTESK